MNGSLQRVYRVALAGVMALMMGGAAGANVMLHGAGATFPYPIYSKWFDEYHRRNPDIRINFQAIGSGGGIRQFIQNTVHFGATDAPMTARETAQVDGPFHHIPTVLGGIVPAFNLRGIETLNFTGEILAGIYLGEIQSWDDPLIRRVNPGVNLPRQRIAVIHRADGSGTTYCFTEYLSAVSPNWQRRVGHGQSVNWPTGFGAKGNEGVSGMVRRTPNAIGFIELVYAKQSRLTYGAVQNPAGRFLKANVETVGAAGAAVRMPEDFRVSIVNAPGDMSYPIATYTWLLIKEENKPEAGPVLSAVLRWIFDEGRAFAEALDYAPLPDYVQDMALRAVERIQ